MVSQRCAFLEGDAELHIARALDAPPVFGLSCVRGRRQLFVPRKALQLGVRPISDRTREGLVQGNAVEHFGDSQSVKGDTSADAVLQPPPTAGLDERHGKGSQWGYDELDVDFP